MRSTPDLTPPQIRTAALMIFVVGLVAITPLLVTIIVAQHMGGWVVTAGALGWLVLVGAYHALLVSRARHHRNRLTHVIDETRRARSTACDSFQDRLDEQQAILGRIITLSQQIVADGITDPQVTLDNVRHLEAQARDGEALIEDTIAELHLENSSSPLAPTEVDVRDVVEEVAARFSRAEIVTAGARHLAYTDRAMLPVMLRNLVSAAVDRGAAQIDMSVARDGSLVIVTVSDDGPECVSVPRLPAALAESFDSTIVVAHRMNRNHFSLALPAAGLPPDTVDPAPLDVLGSRSTALFPAEPDVRQRKPAAQERIVFPEPAVRDRSQTVAARRKDDLIAR